MSNSQDIIETTELWFLRAVPEPTSKNIHTQIGCHFEEVGEMITALQSQDTTTHMLLLAARKAIYNLATHLKASDEVIEIRDREELLDALCDQVVTAVGTGHMTKMSVSLGLEEVNRSNFSKFDENGQPIFNEDQKIIKGPNYSRADLAQFV